QGMSRSKKLMLWPRLRKALTRPLKVVACPLPQEDVIDKPKMTIFSFFMNLNLRFYLGLATKSGIGPFRSGCSQQRFELHCAMAIGMLRKNALTCSRANCARPLPCQAAQMIYHILAIGGE